MQFSTTSEQFSNLLNATRVPDLHEDELAGMETTVRNTLDQLHSYRLAAASPAQIQEYFRLLEAFSHNLALLLPVQRQMLIRQGLHLLRDISHGPATA
ncbi:hypothetical protein KLP40_04290 [Hymenobacter sp. NST-14]|uniref:hypothetical protein n=1 Tax=Hymenobacter piscis TaxID=2839984 RepID=UPI001C02676A|nr:hypothetical protein [Hymenobacter piscis]MBT9392373.1 hypothetical protein [Hymenobacter piscis]